jgi:hypothetical protein
MKWAFVIQQKIRVAFLMAFIMMLVGFTSWKERRNVEQMNRSFSSIYHDRLVPATDIFYLTQNLYSKQLLMEQFLYTHHNLEHAALEARLNDHTATIDNLTAKFARTYLVTDESRYLQEFQRRTQHYNSVESEILCTYSVNSKEKARRLYEAHGRKDLAQTIAQLEQLTKIQSTEGHAIMSNSHGIASNSDLILTLQICLAIVIGLMVQALILASRTIGSQKQNYRMN